LSLAGNDKKNIKVRSISLGPDAESASNSEGPVTLPSLPSEAPKMKVEIKGKDDKKEKEKAEKEGKLKEKEKVEKDKKLKEKEEKQKDKDEKKDKKK